MIDKNLPRNSPLTLTILVGVGLILATVAIGLFVLAGGLLTMFMHAPSGKPPDIIPIPCCDLLLAVLVVLVVIAVLLMLLLWCRCRGGNTKELPAELRRLLALLPQLTQIPKAVRKTAIALEHTSAGLGAINDRLRAAGALLGGLNTAFIGELRAVDNADDFNFIVPRFSTEDVTVPSDLVGNTRRLTVITGLNTNNKVNFKSVKNALVDAGDPLQNTAVTAIGTIDDVRNDLNAAATILGAIATALGEP